MLIFFKILPLAYNAYIPESFQLVEAPLKLLFWYGVRLHNWSVFRIAYIIAKKDQK